MRCREGGRFSGPRRHRLALPHSNCWDYALCRRFFFRFFFFIFIFIYFFIFVSFFSVTFRLIERVSTGDWSIASGNGIYFRYVPFAEMVARLVVGRLVISSSRW